MDQKASKQSGQKFALRDKAIVDLDTNVWYIIIMPGASVFNVDKQVSKVGAVTASEWAQESESVCCIPLDRMPQGLCARIIPGFSITFWAL